MGIQTIKVLRTVSKIVLLVIVLGLLGWGGYYVYRSIAFKPQNIVVTNVTDSSATITWTTSSQMNGVVYYKKDSSVLPGPLGIIGSQVAYDDRDVSDAQTACVNEFNKKAGETKDENFSVSGENFDCENARVTGMGKYYTHSVTIKDLDPESTYYFSMGDGIWSFKSDVASVKTFALLEEVKEPMPVFGRVVGDDGSYSRDGLVYITFRDGSEEKDSVLYSGTTNDDGGWYLDASGVRYHDGEVLPLELTNDSFDMYGVYSNYGESDAITYVLGYFNFPYPDVVVTKTAVVDSYWWSKLLMEAYAGCTYENVNAAAHGNEPLDPSCSAEDLKTNASKFGYGNVIRLQTAANGGDVTKGLEAIGLENNAGNMNAVYGTNATGTTDGYVVQNSTRSDRASGLTICKNGFACDSNGRNCAAVSNDCNGSQISCDNDGVCDNGETVSNCAADCKINRMCNNDGVCGSGETAANCAHDCEEVAVCGNGRCEGGETSSCKSDCGSDSECTGTVGAACTIDGSSRDGTCSESRKCIPSSAGACEEGKIENGATCSDGELTCQNGTCTNTKAECAPQKCTLIGNVYKKCDSKGTVITYNRLDSDCDTVNDVTSGQQKCEIEVLSSISCRITCGDSPFNVGGVTCASILGVSPWNLGVGGDPVTIEASQIQAWELNQAKIQILMQESPYLAEQGNGILQYCIANKEDSDVTKACKKICKAKGGDPDVEGDDFKGCDGWSSFNILDIDIASKAYAEESTTNDKYAFYLPEVGAYSFEIGDSAESVVSSGNTIMFYIEANGEDGFQMPADADNPTADEDIVLSANAYQISYEQETTAQQYNIAEGINIISFNFVPTNTESGAYMASDVIEQARTNGVSIEYVSTFDGGRWYEAYSCSGDTCTGTNFSVVPGRGYLVKASNSGIVTIPGYNLTSSIPVPFSSGWNLVGIHGYTTAYTARTLIDSINTIDGLTANNVSWWPTSKGKYEGLQVENGTEYGLDFAISPTNGYFVRISEYAPSDTTCKSILWNEGGTLNGTCGNTK